MTKQLLPFPFAFALFATACNQPHTYTIDLSQIKDFDWNGKLIIKDECPSILTGYRVKDLEVQSTDGRAASIDTTRVQPTITLFAPPGQRTADRVTTTTEQPFAFPRKQSQLIHYQNRPNLQPKPTRVQPPTTTQEVPIDESTARAN